MTSRIVSRSLPSVATNAFVSRIQPYSTATCQRREDHKPRTSAAEEEYYILTLATDPTHHETMSDLRKKYFPPKLLKVTAHISLFRALPGSRLPTIQEDIAHVASKTHPFPIHAQHPFRMAHGVGVGVTGLEPAERLFGKLQTKWWEFLSQQDRAGFRAHYTLMNKVDDEQVVLKCLEDLKRDFRGSSGMVCGVALWRYDKGWWRHDEDFMFKPDLDLE